MVTLWLISGGGIWTWTGCPQSLCSGPLLRSYPYFPQDYLLMPHFPKLAYYLLVQTGNKSRWVETWPIRFHRHNVWGSSTSQVQQKSCHSQAAGSVHCTLGMWQPVRTALRREELHNCWCGRQSVGARELHVFLPPCCPGLHICFLSISETQQELGSQVGTGGPTLPCLRQSLMKSILIVPLSLNYHLGKTTLGSPASWILISPEYNHIPLCLQNPC